MIEFEDILEMQRQLQITSYDGFDPADMTPADKMEFIRWNVLALEDELHEALAETGWKPWSTSVHLNEKAFHAELVDAFHFFMNLMIVSDMTINDLHHGYIKKRQLNADRQSKGYDGIAGKCSVCKRALDDPAVECTAAKCSDAAVVL